MDDKLKGLPCLKYLNIWKQKSNYINAFDNLIKLKTLLNICLKLTNNSTLVLYRSYILFNLQK